MPDLARLVPEARARIGRVIKGYDEQVTLLLLAAATGGHVLLEGVPGVGKTTLSKTFAAVTGLGFRRVQLTPDLMPADITGHAYFDQAAGEFKVRKGPVFTNLLLADEINRAPPRTQAALLEVMEERQVTIEGTSLPVPDPFLVLATKNPVDVEGVYPLPEAQLDRFMLHVRMDYPEAAVERAMLDGKLAGEGPVEPLKGLVPALQKAMEGVRADSDVVDYLLRTVRATREHPRVQLGASPRASDHLLRGARALAALDGRDYIVPDDVKSLAVPVLAHRLLLTADAEVEDLRKEQVVADVLGQVAVPVEVADARHRAG
jgi:MoxR-like ATPase